MKVDFEPAANPSIRVVGSSPSTFSKYGNPYVQCLAKKLVFLAIYEAKWCIFKLK